MVRLLTFFTLIFISNFAFSQRLQITSETLKGFVESKNDRVRAKNLEAQAASDREGIFARSFLPTVNISGAQESFKKGTQDSKTQPQYGAEVKINIFNGGKDWLEESKRRLTTQRKSYEKASTSAEQLAEAHSIYWEILYIRDHLAILKETQQINSNNLKSANRRIQSGVATETDRIEFEIKDVELRQQEDSLRLKMQTQIQHLKLLLGLETSKDLSFPEELVHEHNFHNLIKHTEKDHEFLVKPSEILAQELELENRMQKRNYWPKLEAFASLNQYNEREESAIEAAERRETIVGLRLSMNLFDGLSAQREAASLAALSKAADLEASFRKKDIENHIHSEMSELQLLHDQVHDAEENIKRSERYYRLTQAEYSRGVKNSPDVLSASEKIYDMKVRRIAIVKQFQVSKSHLLAKIGR